MSAIWRLLRTDDRGQDIMEYAALAAFLAVAAVAVIRMIGPLVRSLFQLVIDTLS